jgi:hypothetical protein
MKPGDILRRAEEPPIGSEVRDRSGDRWALDPEGWFRWAPNGVKHGPAGWGMVQMWAPVTLVSLPKPEPESEPEWEDVEAANIRIGDDIELVRRYGDTTVTIRGTVTTTDIAGTEGTGFVDLGDYQCTNVHHAHQLRRRVQPEPGIGAAIEVDGERWIRVNHKDADHWLPIENLGIWATWADLLRRGTPTVLLKGRPS